MLLVKKKEKKSDWTILKMTNNTFAFLSTLICHQKTYFIPVNNNKIDIY